MHLRIETSFHPDFPADQYGSVFKAPRLTNPGPENDTFALNHLFTESSRSNLNVIEM